MTGYLATVNTADEQAFMDSLGITSTLWLGGSDAAVEGDWQWVTEPGGPVAMTYANWAPGEPNNSGDEDFVHGWWSGDAWNDIYNGYGSYGVLVEYTPAAAVPVPAAGLLLAAGLGGLAALRRKRAA
ncbi:MAG: VPLPA-CTERM sorting domain-containing protein [Paracoccaceae bacterium]